MGLFSRIRPWVFNSKSLALHKTEPRTCDSQLSSTFLLTRTELLALALLQNNISPLVFRFNSLENNVEGEIPRFATAPTHPPHLAYRLHSIFSAFQDVKVKFLIISCKFLFDHCSFLVHQLVCSVRTLPTFQAEKRTLPVTLRVKN